MFSSKWTASAVKYGPTVEGLEKQLVADEAASLDTPKNSFKTICTFLTLVIHVASKVDSPGIMESIFAT